MGPMDNTTKCVLPQMYIRCCAWNGVLQVNWNNCLFPIGNEQADEFVANVISHTNTVSNQVNKQEHRGATIVSKLTSSRGTTVIPMPNESSQSEPAISKECNGLVHILLVHFALRPEVYMKWFVHASRRRNRSFFYSCVVYVRTNHFICISGCNTTQAKKM